MFYLLIYFFFFFILLLSWLNGIIGFLYSLGILYKINRFKFEIEVIDKLNYCIIFLLFLYFLFNLLFWYFWYHWLSQLKNKTTFYSIRKSNNLPFDILFLLYNQVYYKIYFLIHCKWSINLTLNVQHTLYNA